MHNLLLSILPTLITNSIAIWTQKITPLPLSGVLEGCYFHNQPLAALGLAAPTAIMDRSK